MTVRVAKEATRNNLSDLRHKCGQKVRLIRHTTLIAVACTIVNHVVAGIGTEGKVRHVGKERR
jgi:hypothetical protein